MKIRLKLQELRQALDDTSHTTLGDFDKSEDHDPRWLILELSNGRRIKISTDDRLVVTEDVAADESPTNP